MTWVLTIAGFISLVVLHEAGHFVAAKAVGMRVERFFLFFPPKVVSTKIGETEYGIGAIPLGGFVKITGMNPDEVEPPPAGAPRHEAGLLERVESVDQDADADASRPGEPLPPELRERAYYNQPVWKRIVVIGAGPLVNIVIAFFLLFGLSVDIPIPQRLNVDQIEEKTPLGTPTPAAEKLELGDRIVSVDGISGVVRNVDTIDKTRQRIDAADNKAIRLGKQIDSHKCAGKQVNGCRAATPATVVVYRNGKQMALQLFPYYDKRVPFGARAGRHRLGFQYGKLGTQMSHQSAGEATDLTLDGIWQVTSGTASVLAKLFDPEKRKELSGPVGTSRALNKAIGFDTRTALTVLAVISLSLGLINLLPFLPLDGGHIFWSLVEKLRGRRVTFATMERASALGFMLVLVLFVIGLTNDLGRLGDDPLTGR